MEFCERVEHGAVLTCRLGYVDPYEVLIQWNVGQDGKVADKAEVVMKKWKLGYGGSYAARLNAVV